MGTVLGLLAGTGVFCVWWSWWERSAPAPRSVGWSARTSDLLVQAGLPRVTPARLVGACVAVGTVAWVVVAGLTRAPSVALVCAAMSSRLPIAIVNSRARKRRVAMRDVWPEAVDNIGSAIRAGMSLPEALGQLGERGPRQVRSDFAAFAQDFRATGRFDSCLDALKSRLADPVADRIVEALRVTRDVGGSDLGRVLRTLSAFLREDSRTRGELESRQSWTVNAARLAVVAPWLVLLFLAARPETAAAFNSPAGLSVLVGGAVSTVVAYRIMARVGRLPTEERVMR